MSVTRGRSSIEGLLVDWSLDQPAGLARLPVALLSRAQKAAELQRVQRRKAMDAAYEAELVLGLADETTDRFDPPPGTPGARKRGWAPDAELPGVSEFFTAELSVLLNCGRGTAAHLARRSWAYREALPATWAALRDGGDRRTPRPRTRRRAGPHRPAHRPAGRSAAAGRSGVVVAAPAARPRRGAAPRARRRRH